jgi:hypothetical protein
MLALFCELVRIQIFAPSATTYCPPAKVTHATLCFAHFFSFSYVEISWKLNLDHIAQSVGWLIFKLNFHEDVAMCFS